MYYFPRLQKREAVNLLGQFTGVKPEDLVAKSDLKSERQYWYPTAPAGQRISPASLAHFQSTVRDLAREYGYPTVNGGRAPKLTAFDRDLTAIMLDLLEMIPSEASVEAVWSFLSLVVLPDVAFWRFPNRGEKDDFERVFGRPRHVFRRLWWRAYVLGAGADGLGAKVFEDEAVGILERTRLAGNRQLARLIAETHITHFSDAARRTEILRDAMKRIGRLHAFVAFHALSESELKDLVVEAFVQAGAVLLEE